MKKFQTYVLRPGTGRTIPQATISVRNYPSIVTDAVATVFSDDLGTLTIAQPFLATSSGSVEFYAPDGRYDIYVIYADISYTLVDVWNYNPNTPLTSVTNLQNAHYVTDRAESTLNNELIIPSFQGHPDIPPTSPSGWDNEFGAADGSWANVNTDGNSVVGLANSRLHVFQKTTQRTNPVVGFERTSFVPGTGDWTVTSQISLGYHPGINGGEFSGERPFFGLGIKDNLGNIAAIGLRAGSQGISVYYMDFASGGLNSSVGFQQVGSNTCYVRFRHPNAGHYFLEWSRDGISWITVKDLTTLLAGTITRYGLYAYASFDTGGLVDCYSDFARLVTTVPY